MTNYDIILDYFRIVDEKFRLSEELKSVAPHKTVCRVRKGKKSYYLRKKVNGKISEESITYERYRLLSRESREFYRITARLKEINNQICDIIPKLPALKIDIANRFKEISKTDPAPDHLTEYEPAGLKYRTLRGDMVRSKGESVIADTLFVNKIPYEYEKIIPGLGLPQPS